MGCLLRSHTWGWPRRREGRDVQVCVKCGARRTSVVQFQKETRRNPGDSGGRPLPEAEAAPALQTIA
jgi:hypothetical protein